MDEIEVLSENDGIIEEESYHDEGAVLQNDEENQPKNTLNSSAPDNLTAEPAKDELSDEFAKEADEFFQRERYIQLRKLGLSSEEAYLVAARQKRPEDNRSHLSSSLARGATSPSSVIPEAELRSAREIFIDMSDAEIKRLYKRVKKDSN